MLGGDVVLEVIKQVISYAGMLSDEEQRFRDLFGKKEQIEAKEEYFQYYCRSLTMLDFYKEKTKQKLMEQDGEYIPICVNNCLECRKEDWFRCHRSKECFERNFHHG